MKTGHGHTTNVGLHEVVESHRSDSACKVLAVGDTETWTKMSKPKSTGPITFVGIHEISEELLSQAEPDVIVSPLTSRRFDCLDLAGLLHGCDFRGKYRVLDGQIPNPDLIVREVRSVTPGLDFDIFPDFPDDFED